MDCSAFIFLDKDSCKECYILNNNYCEGAFACSKREQELLLHRTQKNWNSVGKGSSAHCWGSHADEVSFLKSSVRYQLDTYMAGIACIWKEVGSLMLRYTSRYLIRALGSHMPFLIIEKNIT